MTEYKPRYLVMVTASANNNKYYRQIPNGDTWIAEYGRVGSNPQRRTYPMSQWESKYKEKIKKGYVDQTDLAEDLMQVEKSKQNNKYKEIEYEAVHYDPPLVILDRIEKLEEEIQKGMAELRKLLSEEQE